MAWRRRLNAPEPAPSRAQVRQQKAVERLSHLAYGLGFKVEEAKWGRIAITGTVKRIEELINMVRNA